MGKVTRVDLVRLAAAGQVTHKALHAAFKAGLRKRDPDAYSALVDTFRRGVNAAYPSGTDDWPARMDAGDLEAIECAVVYIEADPWVFRSGYFKARLLPRLRRAALTDEQRAPSRGPARRR